jgi:23S rRNA pseudouridine2605 synthase
MPAYDASDDEDHIDDDDAPGVEGGGERVAKALARAGVASRREVERLIEDGKVAINGVVLTTPAVKVAPGDIVTVNGKVVGEAEPTRLFRYHKPVGLVTSHNDTQDRPTVFAALPPGLPRLISIGRLDLNSEGLLLLTNDGELSRALELPSTGWPRRYRARAYGHADQGKLDQLKAGVTIEGVKYGPIEATLDKAKDAEGYSGRNLWITVTLSEGKNREVRRVLESIGLKVNRLIRLAYGPFALGTLAQGEVEEVGPRVIREQLAEFIPEASMPKGDRPQYAGSGSKASRRAPTQSSRAEAGTPRPRPAPTGRFGGTGAPEVKEKIEYKPGWARAKRPDPRGPSKPKTDKGAPKSRTAKPNWRDAPATPKFGDSPAERAPRAFVAEKKRNPKAHGPRPSRPRERPEAFEKPAPGARTFVKSYARASAPKEGTERPPLPKEGAERRLDIAARATRERREGRSGPDRKPSGPGKTFGKPSGPRADGPRPESRDRSPVARGDAALTPYERARKEFGDLRPGAADGKPRRDDGPPKARGPRPQAPRADAPRPNTPRSDKPAARGAFVKGGAHRSEAPKGGPKPGPKGPGSRPPGRKGPPKPR